MTPLENVTLIGNAERQEKKNGLKLIARTSDGKPVTGKIGINSTELRLTNEQGEIYFTEPEFQEILKSLSNNGFKSFSSINYKFKKYSGLISSNFDMECNEMVMTFDVDPNVMPPKFAIQKWKVIGCTLSYLNDNKHYYRHKLSKEDCK